MSTSVPLRDARRQSWRTSRGVGGTLCGDVLAREQSDISTVLDRETIHSLATSPLPLGRHAQRKMPSQTGLQRRRRSGTSPRKWATGHAAEVASAFGASAARGSDAIKALPCCGLPLSPISPELRTAAPDVVSISKIVTGPACRAGLVVTGTSSKWMLELVWHSALDRYCGEADMSIGHEIESRGAIGSNRSPELKEVVFGLHWDPPHDAASDQSADLDALCVLFGSNGLMLEVIHPGHLRSVDGCVTHTGDSRNGASHWDDERIFVFLEALPKAVEELALVVMSATGKSFDVVPGARCHVSDRVSEAPHVQIELSTLCGRTIHTVSVMRRSASGWEFSAEDAHDDEQLFAELERRVRTAK